MTRRHERNHATTVLRQKRRAFRKLVKVEALQDCLDGLRSVDAFIADKDATPDTVVSHILVTMEWIAARNIQVHGWICCGKYKHGIVHVPSGIICMTIEPNELSGLAMKPWPERVTDALQRPAPTVLYHATTPRKVERYKQSGGIHPPVRGFDTLEAAQEWARLTAGRNIIMRITVEHAQVLPDHHNALGLAWWSPVKCSTYEFIGAGS